MKKLLLTTLLSGSVCALSAQNYIVKIETFVGNKSEDKIVFNMSVGDGQKKGFDAMMFAKRYRGEGYSNRILDSRRGEEKEASDEAKAKSASLEDKAKAKLSELRFQKSQLEYSVESSQIKLEDALERIKVLEGIVEKMERRLPNADKDFAAYVDKYEERESEEDIAYRKMARKRPRNTGDVDEIEVGSYCEVKIGKGNDKAVMIDFDFAYSRPLSFFYSDANNNGNTVTKHPVYERFEKYGVKNLVLKLGETYCYQFGRLKPEEARSLQEALNSSALLGGMSGKSGGVATVPQMPANEYDDEGPLAEIKKKHSGMGSKIVRVQITVEAAK